MSSSNIDFKKELEVASKSMIMIHDPKLLIKLIVRMIVRKLAIKHAAMILFDASINAYVLSISRGMTGIKVPSGFTRFSEDSPIIKLFRDRNYRLLTINRNAIVSDDINQLVWRESLMPNGNGQEIKDLLYKVETQMQMLNTVACVPAYYRDELMAVLLLGEKHDESRFEQEELNFFAALASDAAMAIRNAQLFEGLKRESEKNRKQFIQTIIVLGSAIEAKDVYTHGHTERVTRLALDIARQMVANNSMEFPESFFENLYIASLLHDIGKIGIPESILHKHGKLTEEEYEIMKEHPVRGAEMVQPLSLPQECIEGIKYHHVGYDGSGYPKVFGPGEIPISAAIVAVADAFDAMTSDRPYRKAMAKATAIKELETHSGTQFHPLVVQAILELYQKGAV